MKYLYCIIPTSQQQTFDAQGIAAPAGGQGGQVYTIPYADLSLVVSDSELIPFTSIRKDELVKCLLAHQSTIEKIMQNYSVIPLKFGTFLETDEETRKIMERGYDLFKEALKVLNEKMELDLVLRWSNFDEVLKEIGEREEIRKIKEEIFQRPLGERVQAGIELGKKVKDILEQKNNEIRTEVSMALNIFIIESRKHGLANDQMIMNDAYLIEKRKKEDFDWALEILNALYQDKINFRCVGPLPPYSFATFEVKKLTSEEIAYAKTFLEITGEPNPEEVKRAYHTLAQKLHPDKNPGSPDAVKQFEELKKAFDVLYEYSNNGRDLILIKELAWKQLNTRF